MSDVLVSGGTFLGGLGIFLLAVGMLTEGLRLAAGDALRGILARSTRTPLRGVASGVLVTAVVQSSSAVTVATIGFVNAGLLSLSQALGVVYGANIGTTVTGWLVAAVGFDLDLEAFALPLIGIGMLLRLVGSSTRIGAAGEALAGFGLFFVGVDVLKTAFEGAAASFDLAQLSPQGVWGLLACLAIGVAMTVATQSSSASIAITLTAATSGVLALDTAAAMVIGANVGTTSTAVLATMGATASARRVAAAHVAFNGITALVALLLLPALLWGVGRFETLLGMPSVPAVSLALFHTVFNVLGVVLMLPLTPRLAAFLDRRFVSSAERLGRPMHLDRSVAGTPSLAMDALILELTRLLALTRTWVHESASAARAADRHLTEQRDAIRRLSGAVVEFLARLERSRLTQDVAQQLPIVLRILNYVEEATELAQEAAEHAEVIDVLADGPVGAEVLEFQARALAIVAACDPEVDGFDADRLGEELADLKMHWHGLKDVLLEAGADGRVPFSQINPGIESLRNRMRLAEQFLKAARRLRGLALARPLPEVAPPEVAEVPVAEVPVAEAPVEAEAGAVNREAEAGERSAALEAEPEPGPEAERGT
ncbi:MAG TPA: Na/Pi symporter [Pseudomonadales bacterium]|nr:Na/Pi symporter [Pseudomonadales bacterium]